MNTIVRSDKKKSITKASGLFSFLPLGLTGGATALFMEAWWPIALLNAPAVVIALGCFYGHAQMEIARLYAKTQYDYDLDLYEGKRGYREDINDKVYKAMEAVPFKAVAGAVMFKKPFDIVMEKKVDETYGEVDIFKASFDGKELEVKHINEPSIFDIMTDAIGNARKLK